MINPEISRGRLMYFLVLFDTANFKGEFNSIALPIRSMFEWAATVTVPAETEVMERMQVTVLHRRARLTETQISKRRAWHFVVSKLSKARQLHTASLAIETYAMKEGEFESSSFTSLVEGTFLSLCSAMRS